MENFLINFSCLLHDIKSLEFISPKYILTYTKKPRQDILNLIKTVMKDLMDKEWANH